MTTVNVAEQPQMRIVGLLYHGKANADELPQLWDRLNQRQGEISPPDNLREAAYGISVMGKDFALTQTFDYIAGFPSDMRDDALPEGMVSFTLPGCRYAIGLCPNLNTIEATIDDLYNRWLPESGYALDSDRGDICIEIYDQRFDPATGAGEFSVGFPVKSKPPTDRA